MLLDPYYVRVKILEQLLPADRDEEIPPPIGAPVHRRRRLVHRLSADTGALATLASAHEGTMMITDHHHPPNGPQARPATAHAYTATSPAAAAVLIRLPTDQAAAKRPPADDPPSWPNGSAGLRKRHVAEDIECDATHDHRDHLGLLLPTPLQPAPLGNPKNVRAQAQHYTGFAADDGSGADLEHRIAEHLAGDGARITQERRWRAGSRSSWWPRGMPH